jgi:4-coumarate--CoA ligase
MPKFDFVQMLEHVQRFKITTFVLVPPVAVALSKYADVSKYDLSSITSVGSGAAPLSRAVSADVEKLWPDGTINFKVRVQRPASS